MKVSIVTVCFNSARTVVESLRSVGEQDHGNIEHIVVDGGSTDGTVDLVRAHGVRVSRLVSERDNGIFDAMNKGLDLSSGEYIAFLNSDDVYADSGVVSRVLRAAGGRADAVYGDLVYVNGSGNPVRKWRAGEFSPRRLVYGWMPPHPSLFVRRAVLKDVGGFDASYRIAGDYDCILRIFRRKDIVVGYLPEVLVRMRMGGVSNGSLKSMFRKSREDLQALRRSGIGGAFSLVCKNARKLSQFDVVGLLRSMPAE